MDMPIEKAYSIRDLSEMTGVNAVTLRAWERRYGLLQPQRTTKGHRFYVLADVEKVHAILNWLDRGVAISKVRPLLETDASKLSEEHSEPESHWQDAISRSLALISRFQREALEQQLNELFASYPLDTLATNYFTPLQAELDRQAPLRFGGRAEQVFFHTELRADLLARIRHANSHNNGDRLLLLVLDGREQHIPPLLLALSLLEAGFRLHVLLDHCNLREIPYIVEQVSSQPGFAAVLCHCDSKPETGADRELQRAASHTRLPFFISGNWLDIQPALEALPGLTALPARLRPAVARLLQTMRPTP